MVVEFAVAEEVGPVVVVEFVAFASERIEVVVVVKLEAVLVEVLVQVEFARVVAREQ